MQDLLVKVQNPTQAAKHAKELKNELPKIEAQHKRLNASMFHLGDTMAANKVTPEMQLALDVWAATEAKAGPAIEVEMARIVVFYPQLGTLFKRYLATYN